MKTRFHHFARALMLALGTLGMLTATLSASAASVRAAPTTTWIDNFTNPAIDPRWSWVRQDATHWSLSTRPGFLRITLQRGVINSGTNKNMLVQPAPVGDFEIQTRVIFTPTENIQRAGLVIYQDNTNFLLLSRAFCAWCVGNGIYFDQVVQNQYIGSNFGLTTAVPGEAYLRVQRLGTAYAAYASTNGVDWTFLGTHTVSSAFVPSKIGLMVDDADFGTGEIPADFDFFRLDDSTHYLYLPLVIK